MNMIYKKSTFIFFFLRKLILGGGWVLSYERLKGMFRWVGSHFDEWIDYNGVSFSLELLEWGHTFSDFWGKKVNCSSYLQLANIPECLYCR